MDYIAFLAFNPRNVSTVKTYLHYKYPADYGKIMRMVGCAKKTLNIYAVENGSIMGVKLSS